MGISAFGRVGDCIRAISLLETMRNDGVAANVVTFNAAIHACAGAKEWERAVALLVAMPSADVKPDKLSFNSCISACAKAGQWERAVSLLVAMRSAGLQPDVADALTHVQRSPATPNATKTYHVDVGS